MIAGFTWLFNRSCWTSSFKCLLRFSRSRRLCSYSSGTGTTNISSKEVGFCFEDHQRDIPSLSSTEVGLAVRTLVFDEDESWSSSATGSLNDTDRALVDMAVVLLVLERAVMDLYSSTTFFDRHWLASKENLISFTSAPLVDRADVGPVWLGRGEVWRAMVTDVRFGVFCNNQSINRFISNLQTYIGRLG